MSHVLRHNVADQIAYFRAYNTDGSAKTDLTSATAGLTLSVFRVGASSVSIASLSNKVADDSTHADGAIRNVGGNLYTIDLPDASTSDLVPSVVVRGSFTGGVIEGLEHPIVAYNPALTAVGANTTTPPTTSAISQQIALDIVGESGDWGDAAATLRDGVIVGPGGLQAASISTGAFTAAKFAAGAITSSVIAANAIGASQIASAAITSAKFAASAINASAIATDAINSDKISASAVTKIQDGLPTSVTIYEQAEQVVLDYNLVAASDLPAGFSTLGITNGGIVVYGDTFGNSLAISSLATATNVNDAETAILAAIGDIEGGGGGGATAADVWSYFVASTGDPANAKITNSVSAVLTSGGTVEFVSPYNQQTSVLTLVQRADYKAGTIIGALRWEIDNEDIDVGDTIRFGAALNRPYLESASSQTINALGTVVDESGTLYAVVELTKEEHTDRLPGTDWRWELEHIDGDGNVSPLYSDQQMILKPSRGN